MTTRVVVLPPVPALLPANLGRVDPVADLRKACREAVAWLTDGGASPVTVLADPLDDAARRRGVRTPLGVRVALSLLHDGKRHPDIDVAGARVYRVHEVGETRRAVDMAWAIAGRRPPARAIRGLA